MTQTGIRRITIDEFLALPEERPWKEYLRGEVTEKPMPNDTHGTLVMEIGGEIRSHLKRTGQGYVSTEVRHADRTQDWVYLPDIKVHLYGDGPKGPHPHGPVAVPPDFAIEILSPSDRVVHWLERVQLYMAAGTRLLWIVDPEEESIRAFRPGGPTTIHRPGDIIDAEPVLHGFQLDVRAVLELSRR
ncbi:MAG: Uma2 family endonuclease [Dehalococcoidia bacterium]